jgi:subtilisin-like proprotein convertase family protein
MRAFRTCLLLLLVSGWPSAVHAVVSAGGDPLATETYDIRVFGGASLEKIEQAYDSPRLVTAAAARDVAQSLTRATERLRSLAPGARVEPSPLSTGIEVVASAGTPLTAPAPGRDGPAVVRGFLRAWPDIYGLSSEQIDHLEVLGESRQDGLTVVRLRQTVRGRPVFQSDTRAVLDREGRLLHTVGRLIPGIDEAAVSTEWQVGDREALRLALMTAGSGLDLVTRPARSEQVYFPLAPGVVVPAWAHVAFTRGPADWYTVVDARTGTLLWRKNIRYNLAAPAADTSCAEVYLQDANGTPADSPAPHDSKRPDPEEPAVRARTEVSLPDASIKEHELTSHSVKAFLDRNGDDSADPEYPPTQAARRKKKQQGNCNPPFFSSNDHRELPFAAPEEYSPGAVATLFYLADWFHDRLAALGFNEEAGNFQTTNASGKGSADDPVLAAAQYAAADGIFNFASFSSPPDGSPGILRLSVWNGPEPDRDVSLDAQIVFHELAHGVTSRMIGNGACLNWYPGRALGEGWSDFYALALLNGSDRVADDEKEDNPDGVYSIGGYTAHKLGGHADFTDNYFFGLRRYPYSTAETVNPLTWKDVDDTTTTVCRGDATCSQPEPSSLAWENGGANEIHNAGELWALSLWEVRSLILGKGDVATGNNEMLKLVTNALQGGLTPCDPSFTQARDALLDADCQHNECAHEGAIWAGFAKRGLGHGAQDSGGIAIHSGIHESFGLPVLDLVAAKVVSASGKFLEAGAPGTLTVTLKNPWRSRAIDATAKLSCAHAATDATAEYHFAQGNGEPIEKTFALGIDSGLPSGTALGCTLKLETESLKSLLDLHLDRVVPDDSIVLDLRVGQSEDGLVEEPHTYKWPEQAVSQKLPCESIRDLPVGTVLDPGEIPDGDLRGRCFSIHVEDDFSIGSVALRIDELTHPWVGDLTVLLKGPNGYGTELIYRLARNFPGTTIPLLGASSLKCLEETVVQEGGKDFLGKEGLEQTLCFQGTWAPPLQSSLWLSSAKGQLDELHGISSKGLWTLFITDAVPDGNGKADDPDALLKSWTLMITP